ncbi:class II SORL domain-containing protein [Pseudothermotoga thermarum]|uniref:Superoxide reductase n=1 Tax=Pseudothermotoga thermarum DSM 5069 TaxID=688269 RepID=F7YVI0_9THEM|nr:class II SORL domain-containing protein [Pseudothermotoga thermarum]AEH51635.1 Superoxide reductase [Pseudothermotoga thermarum DSM 5069]
MPLSNHIQSADWKAEKHVPVIECADVVKANEWFEVKVSVGKEIPHPNTTEHHIKWIKLFFMPEGEKFIYDVATFEFNVHGESVAGANQGSVWTHSAAVTWMKVTKPGTLYALAYCNIHGLWESSKQIKVE